MTAVTLFGALVALPFGLSAFTPDEKTLDVFAGEIRQQCLKDRGEAGSECLATLNRLMYVEGTVERDYEWLARYFEHVGGQPVPPGPWETKSLGNEAQLSEGADGFIPAGDMELKGIKLGFSEAQVRARLGRETRCTSPGRIVDRICTNAATTFGGRPATATVGLLANQAAFVQFQLDSSSYGLVRDGLEHKFGKPSLEGEQQVSNRMGASFLARSATWQSDSESVRITERSDTIDEMLVRLDSVASARELLERWDEDAARAADDM